MVGVWRDGKVLSKVDFGEGDVGMMVRNCGWCMVNESGRKG